MFLKGFLRLLPLAFCLAFARSAAASDLEELAKQGYAVVEQTEVRGQYEGCEFDRVIQFLDGLSLQCTSYSYHYAYQPEVLIMQHISRKDFRVLIDGEQIEGRLVRPPALPPGFTLDK